MARTSKNEKTIFTLNGNNRSKFSQINTNHKVYKSEDFNEQNMLHPLERTGDRRNALGDTSTVSTNAHTSCQKHCYHQLVERVRELEKEIVPDLRLYQISPAYSPFSAITPSSNVSGNAFPNYSRPQNFPGNLLSPNSSVPTQRFGLSSKVLERAHQIPERFWVDWRQKQMQNRIEELENMKNNLTSPNNIDSVPTNRRKSLLLLHDTQRRIILPRSAALSRIVSTSIDTDTSSSDADDQSSFDLNTPSPIEPISPVASVRRSHATLDRSRLAIFLPYSSMNNHRPSITKSPNIKNNLIETQSYTSSTEDVAQIDTEVNLTLLSRKKSDQTNPLLYSKAIMNRTIAFRSSSSSSKKDSSINQNEISTNDQTK